MKVAASQYPTELSYMELVAGLIEDINSDPCIPSNVKKVCLERLKPVGRLLEDYSG